MTHINSPQILTYKAKPRTAPRAKRTPPSCTNPVEYVESVGLVTDPTKKIRQFKPFDAANPMDKRTPTRGKYMTNIESQFPTHQSYDDEIDLWQLAVTLWEGKYWIIGITFLFMLAGLGYAKLADEEWESTAKVIEPDYSRYQQVLAYTRRLEPAFGNQFNERIKNLNFGNSEEVFKRFITLYNSGDNKREFLQAHPSFQQRLKAPENTAALLNNWSADITATSNKNTPDEFELSFTGTSAAESQTLLMEYIQFSNRKVADDFQQNISSMVTQRIAELKQTKSTLELSTKNRINREIERLSHSLAIAKAANVNTPIVDPGTKDEFDINLGTRAIEAKITELKSMENLAVIEPALLTVQNQLSAAESVDLSQTPAFEAYKFIQTPTEPLSRSHPKTLLILLACMMIGGIVGVVAVFIKNSVRAHLQPAQ